MKIMKLCYLFIYLFIGGYNKCGKKASITSKVVTKVIR